MTNITSLDEARPEKEDASMVLKSLSEIDYELKNIVCITFPKDDDEAILYASIEANDLDNVIGVIERVKLSLIMGDLEDV